jgi:hypothetical protein
MIRWRGLLGAATLALLALGAAPAAAEMRLSPDEARQFAVRLAQHGQPTAARAAAEALLLRDPNDVVALIVLSRSARDLGDYAAARKAAARAWRLGGNDRDRFAAGLAMAQALASEGRRGAAQFWLRRAGQVAPDARTRTVARRDFAYVRSRNPWRAKLSFGAFPSSNVNDGPTTDSVVIGGLEFVDPDAVPLSGFGATAAAGVSYRFGLDDRSDLTLGIEGSTTRYALSAAAKRRVPDASAADYDRSTIALSAGWNRRLGQGLISATVTRGRDWYGGAVLSDWTELALNHVRAQGQDQQLRFGLTLTDTQRHDADIRSSQAAEASFGWGRALAGGGRLDAELTLGRVWSDSSAVARREVGLTLAWQRGQPVLGAEISGFVSLALDDYDLPLYAVAVRKDVTATLGVSALLSEVDYMGFSPEVGLTLSQVNSSVASFTTRKAEIHFAIRSTF